MAMIATLAHRLRMMAPILLLATAGCGPDSSRAALGEAGIAAAIPLDLSGPRPTARLAVGRNPPVPVIFDTGAAASILKLDYARSIGLPNEGDANAAGPGGNPVAGFRTRIAGRLGDATFAPALAVALDIPLPLPGVMGAISPAIFSGRLVQFDFPGHTVRVLPATAANTPRGPAYPYSGGGLFAMTVSRVPTAILTFAGGTVVPANLDSGYDGGIELPLSMAHTLRLAGPLAPGRTAHMIGASNRTFVGTLADDLRLGPLLLSKQAVTFVDSETSPPKIGMRILRRRVVVLDPQNHRDWLF